MGKYIPSVNDVLQWFGKLFRLWPAWVITLGLAWIIYYVSPQQVPVTIYKVLLLTAGAILGFWVHVWVEGHIDEMLKGAQEGAKYRRAAYIVGGMIAFALAA